MLGQSDLFHSQTYSEANLLFHELHKQRMGSSIPCTDITYLLIWNEFQSLLIAHLFFRRCFLHALTHQPAISHQLTRTHTHTHTPILNNLRFSHHPKMDLSSQIPPSYQPSLKRPASQISSDDDHDHNLPDAVDQADNHNSLTQVEPPLKEEWRDLSTASIASLASDELHERRPNRWKGQPSTWRNWTKNERKTWESIENVRKGDLSVHLCNAFALKKGVRKGPEETFLGGGGGDNGGWNVGRGWTAWPLGVEEVPGDELLDLEAEDGNQEFTVRKKEEGERWAGRNLEEEISATVLRLAKERFYRRVERWEGKDQDVGGEEEKGNVLQSIEQEGEVGDEEDEVSGVETGYDTAAGYETDATGLGSTKGGKKRRMSMTAKAEQTFTPIMSADDERNYALVRPAARRIMGQLDKTLTVMHHARAAAVHDMYGDDTDDEDSEEEEDGESRNDKMDIDGKPLLNKQRGRSRGKRRSRAGSRPRNFRFRSNSRSSSSDSSGSNVSTKISRIGLQNWRDVLGAAALAGFSPEVIARATQRCSNIFNEEMVMHTLPEQAVTSGKTAIQTVRYQPKSTQTQSPLSEDDDYETNEQLLAHRLMITRQSTVALTAEPVGTPAPTARRADTPAARSRTSRSATPGGGAGGSHLCPFNDCRRAVEGFSRNANLLRHIKLVHKVENPAVQITDEEEDSEDQLVGGVHTDGFLQPIKIRKGWRGDDSGKRQRKCRAKPRSGGRDVEEGEDDGDDWDSQE
ncbi:hypothetical protein QBC41DRAFT_286947 [Cercophora samala]|uniref:C2H2-type domain-containing protein n=1 Tax=Cercophora samala TaxID=330535 RepID=A0AA39YW92_9PEZI|nr:hypothetical protein QBC41DRAFT_286947 [Cercophora samala]